MILKLASVAATLLVAGATQRLHVKANFVQHVGADGRIKFDLSFPRDSWYRVSHGEPLDQAHRTGPLTRKEVSRLIDEGTKRMGICPDGWMMDSTSVDPEGTHHVFGACLSDSTSI